MKNILTIIAIFVVGAFGGIVGNNFFSSNVLSSQSANISTPIIERQEIIIAENLVLEDSIKRIENSVIGVRTKTKNGEIISGSGLVVTSDGLIVIFSDLIPKGGDSVFFVNGKRPNWQILKRDLKANLALVKVELSDLATVAFDDDIRLGQKVFTVGILFTKTNSFKAVNEGIIKFFDDQKIETSIIEKEALIGGALFNIKGELLGLTEINADNTVSAMRASKIKEFLGY